MSGDDVRSSCLAVVRMVGTVEVVETSSLCAMRTSTHCLPSDMSDASLPEMGAMESPL